MTGAGKLDERVEVVAIVQTPDDYGGYTNADNSLGTVWAQVEPVRGQERVIADQAKGVAGYRVTARNAGAFAQATTAHVLVWRGQRMNVRWAPEAGRAPTRMIEAETGVVT